MTLYPPCFNPFILNPYLSHFLPATILSLAPLAAVLDDKPPQNGCLEVKIQVRINGEVAVKASEAAKVSARVKLGRVNGMVGLHEY
jgi:hypothetical protein